MIRYKMDPKTCLCKHWDHKKAYLTTALSDFWVIELQNLGLDHQDLKTENLVLNLRDIVEWLIVFILAECEMLIDKLMRAKDVKGAHST